MATFTRTMRFATDDDKKHSVRYKAETDGKVKPLVDTVYLMREAVMQLTGSAAMPANFEVEFRFEAAGKGDTKPAKAANVTTLRKRG